MSNQENDDYEKDCQIIESYGKKDRNYETLDRYQCLKQFVGDLGVNEVPKQSRYVMNEIEENVDQSVDENNGHQPYIYQSYYQWSQNRKLNKNQKSPQRYFTKPDDGDLVPLSTWENSLRNPSMKLKPSIEESSRKERKRRVQNETEDQLANSYTFKRPISSKKEYKQYIQNIEWEMKTLDKQTQDIIEDKDPLVNSVARIVQQSKQLRLNQASFEQLEKENIHFKKQIELLQKECQLQKDRIFSHLQNENKTQGEQIGYQTESLANSQVINRDQNVQKDFEIQTLNLQVNRLKEQRENQNSHNSKETSHQLIMNLNEIKCLTQQVQQLQEENKALQGIQATLQNKIQQMERQSVEKQSEYDFISRSLNSSIKTDDQRTLYTEISALRLEIRNLNYQIEKLEVMNTDISKENEIRKVAQITSIQKKEIVIFSEQREKDLEKQISNTQDQLRQVKQNLADALNAILEQGGAKLLESIENYIAQRKTIT